MNRERTNIRGMAVLESALFLAVLGMVLGGGWGLAAYLADAGEMEAILENGNATLRVVPFTAEPVTGELTVNRAALVTAIDSASAELRVELLMRYASDADLRIESAFAIVEIDPDDGTIRRVTIEERPSIGELHVEGELLPQTQIRALIDREIQAARELFALPDGLYGTEEGAASYLPRVVLVAVSAAARLDGHVAPLFLSAFEENPYLIRSRVSLLRQQL